MPDFYGLPLARAHAEGFTDWLLAAYPWLLERVRATAPQPILWDVGCGDGSWLAYAQQAGVQCSGIDRSSAFVSMCEQKGLTVTCDDAMSAPVPVGVSAVSALGEVLCYAPAAFDALLERLATSLPAGGGFWFDLVGTGVKSSRGQFSKNDWHIETEVEVSGDVLTRQIRIRSAQGSQQEIHRQRIFHEEDILARLIDKGFAAHLLNAYGDAPLLPGRFAVEARRIA